jgi:predicted dehydrogenase
LSFGFGIFVPGGYRPIAILGSHGRLEYYRYGRAITVYRYAPGARSPGQPTLVDLTKETAEPDHAGTDAMHEDFIRCVKGRLEPLTSGKVMVDSVRMCLAGQEAALRSEVIEILEEFR